MSIVIPTGWTYERNYTSGGLVYDLYLEGPSGDGLMPPVGMMDAYPWPGDVSDEMLFAEMENEFEELEDDPDLTSYTIVEAPANVTVNDEAANDCTILVDYSGVELEMRLVIIANDAWDRCWKLLLMDDAADWAGMSATFDGMVNSVTVDEKSTDDSILIMIFVVAIIVILVAVVVILMRRKKAGPQQFPAPVQQEYGPQAPPPPGQ